MAVAPKAVQIKWSNRIYDVLLDKNDMTIGELRSKLFELTNIPQDRQKLLGLKYQGKPPSDEITVELVLQGSNLKGPIMLMGTPIERALAEQPQAEEGEGEVVNDFDIDYSKISVDVWKSEDNMKKLQKRVDQVKVEVKSPVRKGKKCLVLDIDYTLFDHRSVAERPIELQRPYLHEFLAACYEEYDLVLWSATSMKWIDVKMKELGVFSNPNYKITFSLDHSAMFSVENTRGGEKVVHDVKPLGLIWEKFPEYTPENTIHIDDLKRNFAMNPQNGLQIRPFKRAHITRDSDDELLHLKDYLLLIAKLPSFSGLDHSRWQKYLDKHKK